MNKRKISISTCFNYDINFEKQLEMISDAGFSHISLGENEKHSNFLSKDGRKKILELLDKYNLSIDSIHGCRTDLENSLEILNKTAKAAFELQVRTVVVHTSEFYISSNNLKNKINSFLKISEQLKSIAKKYNVKFALENLHPDSATDVVKQLIPKLDKKYFGFCYDSSHDQVDGPRNFDILDELAERLIAIHISDRIKEFVDHVIPSEGYIDFDMLMKKLAIIGFKKSFLLELSITHSKIKDNKLFIEKAYKTGKELSDKLY